MKSNQSELSEWSANEFDSTDDEEDQPDGGKRRESYLKAEDADEILNELDKKHQDPDIKNEALPEIPNIKHGALPRLPSVKTDALPEIPDIKHEALPRLPSVKTDVLPEIPVIKTDDHSDEDNETYIDFDAIDKP